MGQDLRVLCHTGDVQTVTTPHLFTEMISTAKIFTQSAWSDESSYIRVFFLRRGVSLDFDSSVVQQMFKVLTGLPVTCVPVLCFIVPKLINLFKLVVVLNLLLFIRFPQVLVVSKFKAIKSLN